MGPVPEAAVDSPARDRQPTELELEHADAALVVSSEEEGNNQDEADGEEIFHYELLNTDPNQLQPVAPNHAEIDSDSDDGWSTDNDQAEGEGVVAGVSHQVSMQIEWVDDGGASAFWNESTDPVQDSVRRDSLPLDNDKIDTIKNCMKNFTLPAPEWAAKVPETEWKSHLLHNINKNAP